MKFDVGVPSGAIKHFESWVGEGELNELAVAAEQAGVDSINVTDHPFPQDAWLSNGGHQAFDPFVALTSMAAVTRTIRLRTNLLVAGYRSPYLMARSIASVDVLSHGRMIVGMGAGYLEPEFGVLGGDFAGRGKRFDDAIVAMTAAWTGQSVDRDGLFPAHGHTMQPRPVQQPRPPIWIGGNSKAALRRAAELADGWIVLPQGEVMSKITGSPPLSTLDDLKVAIAHVRELRERSGRTEPFDIASSPFLAPGTDDPTGERLREAIATVEDLGVTWVSIGVRGRSLQACKDELAWLAEHVVAPYHAGR
jgi:probable F420-dependent oxidoreductase